MASAVDSSASTAASRERGTARFRPCQLISTSVTGAGFLWREAPNFDRLPFSERRDYFGSDAPRLKRKSYSVFQVVIPTHGPLFRPISIHHSLVFDALLPDGIFLGFRHREAAQGRILSRRMRRTEVRPTWRRRAISALLIPWR